MNGGVPNSAAGGNVSFNYGRGGNAVFTINGGNGQDAPPGLMILEQSNPQNATLIANGGQNGGKGGDIQFWFYIRPSLVRIRLFDNGDLDIGRVSPPGLIIGSLEGNGNVFLGANNLAIGKNGGTTTFSGIVQDGGAFGGSGGSLTKIGTGNLTFTGANTYTGGTTVSGGILLANNTTGSGTGSGPVQVTAGTFGGGGNISGAVTVGTGTGAGAFLAPGAKGPDTLATSKSLTIKADGNYRCQLNVGQMKADQVGANGVTIEAGAQFVFLPKGNQTLAIGTVFAVINNTAVTPISGTFGNLVDGSFLIAGPNTLQVNYEGGDGNDLTLTVVP